MDAPWLSRLSSDEAFLYDEDRCGRVRRVFGRMGELLSNPFWTAAASEINGIKLLFHASQP